MDFNDQTHNVKLGGHFYCIKVIEDKGIEDIVAKAIINGQSGH